MKLRRSSRALLAATIWATAGLLGSVSGASTAVASTAPTVHVSTASAPVGQLVQVTGAGWAPVGRTVVIQLCGQNALNLSDDCDQAHQYTAAIRAGGVFYGAITIHLPPSPCPCVVAVTDEGGFSAVVRAITIPGAPSSPIPGQAAPPAPVAVSAKVQAPISPGAWFGGPKSVTLVLRVTNRSPIAYESPTLSVNVGRGRNPSGFVVGKPLAPLAVGATQVLKIPVTLPAFTFGGYSVRAQVMTGEGEVATVVGTSSYPWALFVLAALVIQAVLLLARDRVRGRLGRTAPAEIPAAEPGREELLEPVAVIDLRTPQPRPVWTSSNRLALLLPERSLTCIVEVSACPSIGIQRTSVRAWTDFAASPWDALFEGSSWEGMPDQLSNPLLPGNAFSYDGRGLVLELQVSALGPELRLEDDHTVLPVRVEGLIFVGGERYPLDLETTLEQTWAGEPTGRSSPENSPPRAGPLAYGHVPGGDSFYLCLGAPGAAQGWLVRGGRTSSIVQAQCRVEERFGPYPRRVTVECTDELGRHALATGTASTGMAFRDNDSLVLECRTDWDLDGSNGLGEYRSLLDLDAWRTATRPGWPELTDASS